MSRDRGVLALVLHSHMPYVEGFGTWPFGEEWLWEAVATVYLPLIDLLTELDAPLTLGLTPVLCDQLETLPGPAGDRLTGFLDETRRAVHDEDAAGLERTREPELAAEVRRAWGDYDSALAAVRAGGREMVPALARLAGRGAVELWTSSASHAVLPLLASDAGVRLQLATGIASHERRFGSFGGGLWLPECAYSPGLERDLAEHGVRAFCVDTTEAHGSGAPEQLEPVLTEAGVVAVPIDWQTVELVWHDRSGYPVHAAYRDYHRRTVHDLRPWSLAGGAYDPEAAAAQAAEHARDFVAPMRPAAGRPRRLARPARAALLRTGHRAARPLVVRGPGLAAGRGRAITRAGAGAGHGERRRRAGRAGATALARVHLGHGQGHDHLGRAARGRARVRRPPRRAANRGAGRAWPRAEGRPGARRA